MIKNERQYRISKAQAAKFAETLRRLEEAEDGGVHPLIRRAEQEAVKSQLDELMEELARYEELMSTESHIVKLSSFDELPQALIGARISRGLSQRELGERLGLKEQQIQRYEASDYSSASLKRIREIIRALDVKVDDEVIPDVGISLEGLFRRLRDVGLDHDLVVGRLVPESLTSGMTEESEETLACSLASIVGRVFGWTCRDIFGGNPLRFSPALADARFKLPRRGNLKRLSAYTAYAHYVALLVLEAMPRKAQEPVLRDSRLLRSELLRKYGSVEFEAVLDYVWGLGIPVVPLGDPGAFHGACWRAGGRNVLVLKQRNQLSSVWLFDLLHELWHAGERSEDEQYISVDFEGNKERSAEEQAAGQFAGDVVLGGRSEELADMCVNEANGRLELLKIAVAKIARRESVSVGGLANYMAFRLSLQGLNWWGAAKNLQTGMELSSPWRIARDEVITRVDFGRLADVDRWLLTAALRDNGL